MAKDPKDRYATAGDLAAAAHEALAARDQDKADTILARTSAATIPAVLTPRPSGAGSSTPTPSPFVAASTQPPYQPPPPYPPPPPPPGPPGPGGWGPPGPMGPGGPGGPPPGGPPPWQPPPSGPMPSGQPPNRNLVPIIVAVVVAFVLVVGGVVAAVVLLSKSGGNNSNNASGSTTTASASESTTSSKTRTSTSGTAPSTSSTAGQSGASARLLTLVPDGYGPGACKTIDPVTDALATVDCEKNTQPGGPDVARYSLFPDQATLDRHFASATKEDDELVMCPGANVQSPTTWHYTTTPDKVEGQVACGTYKGGPDVLWTRNTDLLLADGQGSDLPALHDWWLKYG